MAVGPFATPQRKLPVFSFFSTGISAPGDKSWGVGSPGPEEGRRNLCPDHSRHHQVQRCASYGVMTQNLHRLALLAFQVIHYFP